MARFVEFNEVTDAEKRDTRRILVNVDQVRYLKPEYGVPFVGCEININGVLIPLQEPYTYVRNELHGVPIFLPEPCETPRGAEIIPQEPASNA